MVNMDQNLMQSKGVSPTDVLNAVNAQNLILPSGTAKVAESELGRSNERDSAHGGGTQRYPDQAGRQHNDLPKRSRKSQRWLRCSDQCGSTGWTPRRTSECAQVRQFFNT